MSHGGCVDHDLLAEQRAWAFACASRLVHDSNTAEDIAQEAVLVAYASPPKRRDAWRTWLATVVRNLTLNHLRSAARRQRRERDAAWPERVVSVVSELGIAVNVNPANPGYAAVTGASGGYLDPGTAAGGPVLYAAGFPLSAQIYYRPTHDPVHPGWGPGFPGVPAGTSVMDNSMQTCLLLADQLNASLRAPIPPAPPFTGVLFVLDVGPASPTALEAFQIQIIR